MALVDEIMAALEESGVKEAISGYCSEFSDRPETCRNEFWNDAREAIQRVIELHEANRVWEESTEVKDDN